MRWLVHLPHRIAAGKALVVLVPHKAVYNPKPCIFRGLTSARLAQGERC